MATLKHHHIKFRTGPDGNPLEMSGTCAEVARRQADGTWKYVLLDPFAG